MPWSASKLPRLGIPPWPSWSLIEPAPHFGLSCFLPPIGVLVPDSVRPTTHENRNYIGHPGLDRRNLIC